MSERALHRVRSLWTATAATNAGAQVVVRVAMCFTAMAVHYLLAPTLFSWKPLLSLTLFAALIIARQRGPNPIPPLAPLSAHRLILFMCLHGVLVTVALQYSWAIVRAAETPGIPASLVALGKLVVLLPVLALLPFSGDYWRRIWAEGTTAGLALFTFSPDRFFELIWPVYSRVVAAIVVFISRPLVPATSVTPSVDGVVVVGPTVDMTLGVSCSGIRSIVLFQLLFMIILVLHWNKINRLRTLVFYGVACCALSLVNSFRLAIVYLTSNLTANSVNLSWPLFVLTFLVLIWITHDWIVPPPQKRANSA